LSEAASERCRFPPDAQMLIFAVVAAASRRTPRHAAAER